MSRGSSRKRRALLGLAGTAAWLGVTATVQSLPGARSAHAASPLLDSLPPIVVAQAGELRRLGAGTMRWFGLHVYDAALWVRGSAWDAQESFALDIVYGRSITGKALAESSITEMTRVGFADEVQHARWLAEMIRVFPDVGRNDRLIGVNLKGAGATFFNQQRLLGTIDDPVFARAFFSIWLDPKTREPQLRNRLLGKG